MVQMTHNPTHALVSQPFCFRIGPPPFKGLPKTQNFYTFPSGHVMTKVRYLFISMAMTNDRGAGQTYPKRRIIEYISDVVVDIQAGRHYTLPHQRINWLMNRPRTKTNKNEQVQNCILSSPLWSGCEVRTNASDIE